MKTYHPKNKADWRNWLEKNHLKEDFVWLIFNRKSSPNPNLSWREAVDEALCFGWIDSTKNPLMPKNINNISANENPKAIGQR